MASRELRRTKAKKGEAVSDTIEKKKEAHPLLYVFSIILLVVVVVTFVGSPVAGRLSGGGSIVFGSYEGRDIAYYPGSYFAQQRDQIAAQVRDSADANQDTASLTQSVWYQAYRQTAVHVAVLIQAERAGLHVSEDAIDKALVSYPAYLENGRFSEDRYNKTQGSEKASIRKLVREEALSNQYFRDMFLGLKSSTKEKEFVTAMAKPERSFTFVSLPYAEYPADEVRGFGEANPALFRKVKVSRILVKSGEKEAAEIRRKIAEKASSFEELAKTHSKDGYADKGGDMGWRYAYDLQADFEKKELAQQVFELRAGDVSGVLKGAYGWLIFRCDAEAVDADFSDAAVLDVVKAYLGTYEKGRIEDYFVAKAEKLSRRAGEVGFAAAAREAGAAPVATDFFPVNLQSVFSFAPLKAVPDTATPASAIYSEDFFLHAFSLGKGQASAPIVLDDQVTVLTLLAERELPEATAGLLGSWLDYTANQTMQVDLQAQIMDPAKLKDRFAESFAKLYGLPKKG
jgi:parvulin-like peptidyl-prolyl isomerase